MRHMYPYATIVHALMIMPAGLERKICMQHLTEGWTQAGTSIRLYVTKYVQCSAVQSYLVLLTLVYTKLTRKQV